MPKLTFYILVTQKEIKSAENKKYYTNKISEAELKVLLKIKKEK